MPQTYRLNEFEIKKNKVNGFLTIHLFFYSRVGDREKRRNHEQTYRHFHFECLTLLGPTSKQHSTKISLLLYTFITAEIE